MQTTTIIARDSRTALDEVTRQLGPDALVLETRRHPRGVEVVAALSGYTPPRAPAPQPEPDAFVTFAEQAADIGFDRALLARINHNVATPTDAWTQLLGVIDREVKIAPAPHAATQHICVVGGSGTGKTTVLAQIAARIRRDEPGAPIAFLSADTARHGAREQLRLIAADFGVPVFEIDDIAEAANHRLLIDMPSDPWTARQLADTLRLLPGGLTALSTMPLTAQLARHRQMLDHFAGLTDALVVTHAGDALPPGPLIAALVEARLPLAYFSREADPAGAIEPARSSALYRLIVAALSGASPVLQ